MMMVRDLTTVERELGFRYEMPNGGHYQQVCPRCRRALFGLAQGALWRQLPRMPATTDGREDTLTMAEIACRSTARSSSASARTCRR